MCSLSDFANRHDKSTGRFNKVIYWAGDSTVADNSIFTFPQSGIGQAMGLYLRRDVLIDNRAVNGRSTKSFIDEKRLDAIDRDIDKGDFLFIQFGHNDSKPDIERHTDYNTTFKDNLRCYISVARKHEAFPVLITPLERRGFKIMGEDNRSYIVESHGLYPQAIREVGAEQKVPVLELNDISREQMNLTGDEATRKWFMHVPAGVYPKFPDGKQDNTHLQYMGAVVFAGIIADELKRVGGIYKDLLLEEV